MSDFAVAVFNAAQASAFKASSLKSVNYLEGSLADAVAVTTPPASGGTTGDGTGAGPGTTPVSDPPTDATGDNPAPLPDPAPAGPKIGMNLCQLSYYTTEAPLIDRMKVGGGWGIRGVDTLDPKWLDASGMPIVIPQAGQTWECNVPLDPIGTTGFDQTYIISWEGTGAVDAGICQVAERDPNSLKIVNTNGCVLVDITATDAHDPIRNITVIRVDQVDLYNAGERFNSTFLERAITPFASFRTMDWDRTNGNPEVNWTDRQKTTDACYTRMPIELEVQLADEANCDLWKNIPAHATDDHVRQLMKLVHDTLPLGLIPHFEYSNEVWNTGFEQTQWAISQVKPGWDVGNWPAITFYGYRAAQIAAIAKDVFKDRPYRMVLAGWYGWIADDTRTAVLNGIGYANVGKVADLFHEYAIAPYFGDAEGVGIGNEVDRPVVLGWAQDKTSAGLDSAFDELQHGTLLKAKATSLDEMEREMLPPHTKFAAEHGLELVAYEGGFALTWFMAEQATKPDLLSLYTRMLADPRMGDIYKRWISILGAAGVKRIQNYDDVGPIGEFGPWGALPSIYAAATPRYTALLAAAGDQGEMPAPALATA